MIGAFMAYHKNADIAKAAGLSITTIKRYKRDPEFMSALNERRSEFVAAAVDKMTGSILRDVDVLQEVIDNPEVNPAVRVTAINTKWSHLREWRALLDFDKRLRALESLSGADVGRFRPGGGT